MGASTGSAVPGTVDNGVIRSFGTGATRSSAEGKPDYEGFLSPQVIVRFGEYMDKHRHQADGQVRDSDNWQKGIPRDQYMKSMFRHFVDLWAAHRNEKSPGFECNYAETEETLCALLFNVQGYLFEFMNDR